MNPGDTTILKMEGIEKEFPGVRALKAVDFRLKQGEVHALMGENGAGKSTLIKVITGVYRPDSGRMTLEGQALKPESPQHAQELRIATVYQEVNLCPNLTVAENIFLGREPRRAGGIDWKTMVRDSRRLLMDQLNLDLDPSYLLSDYSLAIQQMVALARALAISARIVILDEPTSSLDDNEVQQLFKVLRGLRDQGLAILFVTHFIDQMYEISDRVTVLRNGSLVGEYETRALPKLDLIAKMIGREYVELDSVDRSAGGSAQRTGAVLEAESLGRAGFINPFSLAMYKGEILGLAGLLGSGRTELAQLLFGIERSLAGTMKVRGQTVSFGSPRDAIARGLGFCPEDRKAEGIIEDLSVRENIVLALQARQGVARYISRKKQEELANQYIKLLNISTPDASRPVKDLSGGNQQKVILARWLATSPEILILDEPTRGIDVGAKAEIQRLMFKLSGEGMAILFISSELDEVLRCSNRIAVLRDRTKIAELEDEAIDEQTLLHTIAKGAEA